jgi:hypothetical protein
VRDSFGVILERATTRGFEAIRFAEDVLGIELLPWQKWLLIHALELNEDGTFRFRIVVLMVARQNGKSTIMQVLTLWRMYVDDAPLVIGTAQDLDVAEEQWQGAVDLAESVPELAEEIAPRGGVVRVNGKKALVLRGGQRYKVKAATRRGARGLSGDLVLLDEIREHQNWDAWAAVTKTTMARARSQIWAASNAGDISSVVLRYLRALAHKALGWPDGEEGIAEALGLAAGDGAMSEEQLSAIEEALSSLGIFEWSAAPGSSVWDRDGWAQANPSMGYTIQERTIAAAAATDPEHVFRTEVLCQFVAASSVGPFPAGSWLATLDSVPGRAERGARRDTRRAACYCVEVSEDRKMSYVALAYWDTEGRVRFELVAQRAGTDWVIPWLKSPDRAVPAVHVTFQTKGAPVSSLLPEFIDAEVPVALWEGTNLAGWFGSFYDRIAMSVDEENGAMVVLTHGSQPVLDLAAGSAVTKKLSGGVKVIDRVNSPHDPAPLIAVVGAVGLLLTDPAAAAESAYEHGDLMVV